MPYTWKNCIAVLLLLMILSSCSRNNPYSGLHTGSEGRAVSNIDFVSFILSLDTLPLSDKKKALIAEDSILVGYTDEQSMAMHFFLQAKLKFWNKEYDTGSTLLDSMKVSPQSGDLYFLKQLKKLEHHTDKVEVVEAIVMKEIQEQLQKAEQANSVTIHHFYDLTAKAFYKNRNEKDALRYVTKYYESHPYKWHSVVKQRYYDVSFLLASRMGDFAKMEKYNELARQLALVSKNKPALARTYDNEAQIYARKGMSKQSLEHSKLYISLLKKDNTLHDVAYYNLALSYQNYGQIDSAIFYYKKAIELNKKDMSETPNFMQYRGLSEAYFRKGAYRDAFEALEYANELQVKSIKEIEATNIAEIENKYQAEKKDRNIAELKSTNLQNEDIIRQQKWILFSGLGLAIGILVLVYTFYQQKSLRQKNNLLHSENNRLKLEQKLLQTQLNPHFVFNSIANLQGLIAVGDSAQSISYLSSFSQLLRDILEQSRKDFIGLDEEIESLENYLHLQQMRYPKLFDYTLTVDEQLDLEATCIPPMLLQPFVENAIEHGFRNLARLGQLSIHFELVCQELRISIADNGNGMGSPKPDRRKKKSLALEILKERLQLLYKLSEQFATFEIIDKKSDGQTGIIVKITLPKN